MKETIKTILRFPSYTIKAIGTVIYVEYLIYKYGHEEFELYCSENEEEIAEYLIEFEEVIEPFCKIFDIIIWIILIKYLL